MTLDVTSFIAEKGGDPEAIRESQRKRGDPVETVDEVIAMYKHWVEAEFDRNQVKKQINTIQKEIAAKRKAKENADELQAEKAKLDAQVAEMEKSVAEEERLMRAKASTIGNLVGKNVPVSQTEDDNAVIRTWHPDGPNAQPQKKTDILAHHEVMIRIGAFDTERGSKIAGHRGYFLTDDGVDLNQALINYGLDFLRKRGYKKIQPPFFMRKEQMAKTAQLDQFDEELYKVTGDGEDKYLIATSEQPISAFHSEELFDQPEKQLPIKYAGYSTCFRKEAGAAGRDTWGIFRVHQFEKVEQFCITQPEHSWEMFDHMVENAEAFYQSLKIPYQVVAIVSGALNLAAAQKYDLEAWFPFQGAYKELVSCSNCTDYQSRRLRIQCGQKQKGDTRTNWVHMLNGTLCATERALCCIVENYQTPEVPVVLAIVFFLMLLVVGWWRRRRRMRQAVTDIRNNSSTTNTNTPAAPARTENSARTPITAPGTGPDAPPRPQRRRRRRRASQISTKSLPAYNEQAGDEEIVLVRRTERDSMSDDDDYESNPRDGRDSTHENSRSFDATPLLDDTSPEMGQISLASSTRGRSIGDHDEQDSQQHPARPDPSNDTSISVSTTEDATNNTTLPPPNTAGTSATNIPIGDAPPYAEAIHTNGGEAGATQETANSEDGQSSQTPVAADPSPSAPDNAAEADTFGTLRPKRKSVFRQLFALNKPGSTSTALSDSVEMAPTAPRQSLSAASATQGAGRHRPSNSISTLASTAASGRGHALSPSLSSLLLTRSRSPTRSSDSLAQRLTISAPIPTTLVRTELSYPRSGPTPEQIRFLSSRDSLGRFGVPYGEEAVAAAARSRENISSMVAPPQYEGPSTENATSEAQTAALAPNSRMRFSTLSIVHSPTAESAPMPSLAEAPPQSAPPPQEHAGTADNNEGSASLSLADQSAGASVSVSGSAMPKNDRRDSMVSANSFVTANEGDRESVAEGDEDTLDTSPPTPTVETYRQAEPQVDTVRQPRPRGQTILIPRSQTDDGHHPQLTLMPATPTVDVPAGDGRVA
ncbi:Cytosolic seryl-tRNA synthetase [Ceratobasidium sp. 370]|nr:Cytosolic seryl-tRNA synthetase [Ceratobasidium sp. 370]